MRKRNLVRSGGVDFLIRRVRNLGERVGKSGEEWGSEGKGFILIYLMCRKGPHAWDGHQIPFPFYCDSATGVLVFSTAPMVSGGSTHGENPLLITDEPVEFEK
jgi:hypothetical protein